MADKRIGRVGVVLLAMAASMTVGCGNNAELLTSAATDSLATAYAGATIKNVSEETEEKALLYSVELDNLGRELEVLIAPDGTVLEEQRQLDAAELSDVVAATVFKASDGAKPHEIEREEVRAVIENGKVVKLAKPRVTYEVEFRRYLVMGRKVIVDDTGKLISAGAD